MNRFIGLIDSGMGGLTVLNQIMTSLPEENTVYFGDMGRAPYGSRSPKVKTMTASNNPDAIACMIGLRMFMICSSYRNESPGTRR